LSTKSWDICACSIEKIDFFDFSKRPLKICILTWFFGVFSQISMHETIRFYDMVRFALSYKLTLKPV
jgi:hypothetical protein